MKKKIVAFLFVALAGFFVWLAILATKNEELAWIAAVLCIVKAVWTWMGQERRTDGTQPKQKPAPPSNSISVYVVKNGKVYHNNSICQHVYGHDRTQMTRVQAKKKGFTPCKNCYPYGD